MPASQDRFFALPIAKGEGATPRMLYRYGVPFIETAWHAPANGSLDVNVGIVARKIFLLGMTESMRPSAWSDPRNYSVRFMVGDKLGQIVLHYADGSTQEFPLVLGESAWWGLPFYGAGRDASGTIRTRTECSKCSGQWKAAGQCLYYKERRLLVGWIQGGSWLGQRNKQEVTVVPQRGQREI
jgi:hypothetical protein